MSSQIRTRPRPEAPEPLDGFETALLRELSTVVREQADAPPSTSLPAMGPPTAHTERAGVRRWLIPVGVAAAGAAALAIAQPFGGAAPAFAVQEQDGAVTVEIHRLEGPEALEAALAEHGIAAVVDYPEEGTMCSPGRYVEAASPDQTPQEVAGTPPGSPVGSISAEGSSGQGSDGHTAFSITLDPADYVDRTLVLESMWLGEQVWVVGVGTATGEVGPCDPVPATGPQFEQGPPGTGPTGTTRDNG